MADPESNSWKRIFQRNEYSKFVYTFFFLEHYFSGISLEIKLHRSCVQSEDVRRRISLV